LKLLKKHPRWTLEQKKKALHKYILKKFKVNIPTVAVCSDHVAPFDFVAAAFFELHDVILALANRNGGKTMDFAILAILDALADDDCEGANFGAIEKQAMRCYGYIKRFIESQPEFLQAVKGKITLGRTEFVNKSWLQVLVATIAGVNSPHPQKLKADEVELISWPILQEALSMPNSKDEIKATTILGSTRKYAHGPMQRLIDEKIAHVYAWCVWESMEPWPADPVMQQKVKDVFMTKFGSLDLLPEDLTKFSGYFKWEDLITRVRTLDEETFLAQWMCRKPDSSGLIYPKFDEILNNHPGFILNTEKPIQIWEDFGYAKTHPNAIGFVDVRIEQMEFTIFDELYITESTTQNIIISIIQKLQSLDLVEPHLKNISREELLRWIPQGDYQINYAEFFTKVQMWIPDYHGLTEIADRRKYGCPIPDPTKITHELLHGTDCQKVNCEMKDISKLYLKENGIPHVRNFIDERRMKMVMDKTIESRNDFLSYSKKRKPDGTFTDDPAKENDHAPDYVHYGTVYNWPNLAYQSFSQDGPPQQETVTTNRVNEEAISPETFTGGLMEKVF
jgi:hypothetical protein